MFHLQGGENLDAYTLLNKNRRWDEDFSPGEITEVLTSEGVALFDRPELYSARALGILVNVLDFDQRRIDLTMMHGELKEMNPKAHVVFLTHCGARERIPDQLLDPFVFRLSFL